MTGRRLAVTGALLGLAFSLSIVVLASLQSGVELRFELAGSVAMSVALVAPFVLALAVIRAAPWVRAGVWLGTGIVCLWFGFASFSIFLVLAVPAAALLIVGGSLALGEASIGPAIALLVGVLAVGVGSSVARSITEDPRCWKRVRTAEGPVWVEDTSSGPGLGQTLLPGEFSGICVSDVATPVEAGVSLGAWAVLAFGVTLAVRAEGRSPKQRDSTGAVVT